MTDLIYILIFSAAFLMVFVSNEIIYKVFKINAEYTRKSVHILSGLVTMFLPLVFTTIFPVLILSVEFVLLLIISIKFDFFKCINNVERKTWGSFLFPVSVLVTFYFSIKYNDKAFFYLPMLIMSLSDPLAAISGKIFTKKSDKKTLTGSLFFAVSSFLISIILNNVFYDFQIFKLILLSLIISISTTFVERISNKGIDNLSIPITVIVILIINNLN